MWGGQVAVYVLQDAGGSILYVGISGNPWERIAAHCATSSWAKKIGVATIEWFPNRDEAHACEARVIYAAQPPENKTHKASPHTKSAARLLQVGGD